MAAVAGKNEAATSMREASVASIIADCDTIKLNRNGA